VSAQLPATLPQSTSADDLMHSPEHRANLLEPTYTTLGLGLAVERGIAILILTEVFVQP